MQPSLITHTHSVMLTAPATQMACKVAVALEKHNRATFKARRWQEQPMPPGDVPIDGTGPAFDSQVQALRGIIHPRAPMCAHLLRQNAGPAHISAGMHVREKVVWHV